MSLFKLPRELITSIFGLAHLKPKNIVSLQRTCKKFQTSLWRSVTHLDLNEWSVDVDPNILLDRLDSNIVRSLDLTGYNYIDSQGNEMSTSDILRRYPSLEILKLDEIPENDLAELSRTVAAHKSLVEITTRGERAGDQHRTITDHVRLVMKGRQPSFNEFLDVPSFNCETEEFLLTKVCPSIDKIEFSSEITSNGVTASGVTFLGAADGSIYVIAKRNGEMVIIQTIKEHIGVIHQLFHVADNGTLLAASEDGTVSKWRWSNSKLTLECKYTLPEPIYFVAASHEVLGVEKSRIAAASKHNLYFILNGKISDETHHFDDEIVAMDGVAIYQYHEHQDDYHAVYIATAKQCYESENFRDVLLMEKYAEPRTNGSSYKHFKHIINLTTTKPFKALMCSSHLSLQIMAMQIYYTITALGSVIQIEYECTEPTVFGRLSPRISRTEISAKKFPECKSMWYSQDYLYAVFSNNKLYRWSLGIEYRYEKRLDDD